MYSGSFRLTRALAALHVGLQLPALVAGTLDAGLLLLAPLATLEVFGAEALDLARLVVGAQLHAQGARAHEAFPGDDAAVVATATVVHGAEVWGQGRWEGWTCWNIPKIKLDLAVLWSLLSARMHKILSAVSKQYSLILVSNKGDP